MSSGITGFGMVQRHYLKKDQLHDATRFGFRWLPHYATYFLVMRNYPPFKRNHVQIMGVEDEMDAMDVGRDYLLEKHLTSDDVSINIWLLESVRNHPELMRLVRKTLGSHDGPFYDYMEAQVHVLREKPETWDPFIHYLRSFHNNLDPDYGAFRAAPVPLKTYTPQKG